MKLLVTSRNKLLAHNTSHHAMAVPLNPLAHLSEALCVVQRDLAPAKRACGTGAAERRTVALETPLRCLFIVPLSHH